MFIKNSLRLGKMRGRKAIGNSGITRAVLAKWHDNCADEDGFPAPEVTLSWEPIFEHPVKFVSFGAMCEGELIAEYKNLQLVAANNPYGGVNLVLVLNGDAITHGNFASLKTAASFDSHEGSDICLQAHSSKHKGRLFPDFLTM